MTEAGSERILPGATSNAKGKWEPAGRGHPGRVPVLGSTGPGCQDAKTEDGTSCLFNKSLLFIQKLTIGFILQILKKKKIKEGKASHQCLTLLAPGMTYQRGVWETCCQNRGAGDPGPPQSQPPPGLPASSLCSTPVGQGGSSQTPLLPTTTRGRSTADGAC